MLRKIIYPGSFDPITNGHIDLIRRASRIFDEVFVAISEVGPKARLFSGEEREAITRQALSDQPKVQVFRFKGLFADFSRSLGIDVVLRSFRDAVDIDYEIRLAVINNTLNPQLETVFLAPNEKCRYVSSSLVKEIASLDGDLSFFVPPSVEQALKVKFLSKKRCKLCSE